MVKSPVLYDLENEYAVIEQCLFYNNQDVYLYVRPYMFFDKTNEIAYTCLYNMFIHNEIPDGALLRQRMIEAGISIEHANEYYFKFVQNRRSSATNNIYAYKLYDYYRVREFYTLCERLFTNGTITAHDIRMMINDFMLDEEPDDIGAVTIDDVDVSKKERLYETRIKFLDSTLSGFFGGQLICIAARPSMGKSTLALQIAKNMAQYTNVNFVTLETTSQEIVYRLIASETGLNVYSMRSKTIGDADFSKMISTKQCLAEDMRGFAIYTSSSFESIIANARKRLYNNGVLIIDYLQLIDSGMDGKNRNEEISTMTRRLKNLAIELNIPIVILSQLNRAADGRIPTLADLRESGAIEQDTDIVIFIHKEDKRDSITDIIFAKTRDCASTYTKVIHRHNLYTFTEANHDTCFNNEDWEEDNTSIYV